MRLQTNQTAKFTGKSNYILTCILYKACSDWSKPATLGNVAQIKKSEQITPLRLVFRALLLIFAVFPRVLIRPSKQGNH